jgi:S-adenosylmethionine:tRNA ribosyltransferase-isomerase
VAAERDAPPLPDLADLDYALPPDRIAQHPTPERDGARLLVLRQATGALLHQRVRDLPQLLAPGDLLVVNTTRVLPARLRGTKLASGGAVEALLLGPGPRAGEYRALVRGRVREGAKLHFGGARGGIDAEAGPASEGEVVLRFAGGESPYRFGETPLPPYVRRAHADPRDAERYQTVYAREPGSVAAPTAGLHFTRELLDALAERGVERAELVLHVGPGTFRPLRPGDLAAGRLHPEPFELAADCAEAVARARERGGRVVAVGTTTARVLETRATSERLVAPGRGTTELLLRPGSPFRVVDALLTNFHLPRSSLLLLVAAFAGRERVLHAYAEAVAAGYRFHSYGDAMLCA